jgi:hypothetical protein
MIRQFLEGFFPLLQVEGWALHDLEIGKTSRRTHYRLPSSQPKLLQVTKATSNTYIFTVLLVNCPP